MTTKDSPIDDLHGVAGFLAHETSVESYSSRFLTKNRTVALVAIIVGVAFLLRLWAVWFGLPFSFRADEYHEVFRALELGSGSFNFERTGKGGYYFLLFFEYGVLFVVLFLTGIVSSAQDFAVYFVKDPSVFYLIGRVTTAVIGAISVFLAYRIGLRAYGAAAGIFASAILCVDFLSAEHSHFITVDVPMTCLVLATLLFAVRLVTDNNLSDYKWAALFAALATTTKLPGILLVVPLVIAHGFVVARTGGGARRFLLSRHLWLAAVVFVVVLGVTNPGMFLSPPVSVGSADVSALADPAPAESEAISDDVLSESVFSAPNLYKFYAVVLGESLGWPLFVIALAGVFYAVVKRTPTDVLLIAFLLVVYLVFASVESSMYFPRYMLPAIAVLALLAGRLLGVGVSTASAPLGVLTLAVFVASAVQPAFRVVLNNQLLNQPDTRRIAYDWFQETVPQGSKVMIEGLKIEPTRQTVPLRDTRENMRRHIDYYQTREPGKATYLRYVLKVEQGRTYDLELANPADLQSLQYYKSEGVEYLVIRPDGFSGSRQMGDLGEQFLADLAQDPEVRLIKNFESDPTSRPGPNIDIYQVKSDARKPSE